MPTKTAGNYSTSAGMIRRIKKQTSVLDKNNQKTATGVKEHGSDSIKANPKKFPLRREELFLIKPTIKRILASNLRTPLLFLNTPRPVNLLDLFTRHFRSFTALTLLGAICRLEIFERALNY